MPPVHGGMQIQVWFGDKDEDEERRGGDGKTENSMTLTERNPEYIEDTEHLYQEPFTVV